jgi:hypothetical protein
VVDGISKRKRNYSANHNTAFNPPKKKNTALIVTVPLSPYRSFSPATLITPATLAVTLEKSFSPAVARVGFISPARSVSPASYIFPATLTVTSVGLVSPARFVYLDGPICTAALFFPVSLVSTLGPISQARPVAPVRSVSLAGTHTRQATRLVRLQNPQIQRDDSID